MTTRYFTKVRQSPRPPLSHNPFKDALEDVIIMAAAIEEQVVKDVRFALTGEEPPQPDGIGQQTHESGSNDSIT
jgi:hypothetical protein